MTLDQYLQLKELRLKSVRTSRPRCAQCKKPLITCYCKAVESFSSNPRFVILMHKAEAKRSIATGRMAHLCLSNSLLFQGTDYSEHEGVNALIQDTIRRDKRGIFLRRAILRLVPATTVSQIYLLCSLSFACHGAEKEWV